MAFAGLKVMHAAGSTVTTVLGESVRGLIGSPLGTPVAVPGTADAQQGMHVVNLDGTALPRVLHCPPLSPTHRFGRSRSLTPDECRRILQARCCPVWNMSLVQELHPDGARVQTLLDKRVAGSAFPGACCNGGGFAMFATSTPCTSAVAIPTTAFSVPAQLGADTDLVPAGTTSLDNRPPGPTTGLDPGSSSVLELMPLVQAPENLALDLDIEGAVAPRVTSADSSTAEDESPAFTPNDQRLVLTRTSSFLSAVLTVLLDAPDERSIHYHTGPSYCRH